MLIQLTESYLGWASKDHTIPAGTYAVGDPALYGAEDYLVTTQKIAEYIDPEALKPPAPASEPSPKPYAEWDDEALLRELGQRKIVLSDLKGSGEDGALTHDDYVRLLEEDDADHTDLGEHAESPYKGWTINDARAAIKGRQIDLAGVEGTGKGGAFRLVDLINILIGDDEDHDLGDDKDDNDPPEGDDKDDNDPPEGDDE